MEEHTLSLDDSSRPVYAALVIQVVKGIFPIEEIFPPTATARRELVLVLDSIEQLIEATHLHYRRIQAAAAQLGALLKEEDSDEIRLLRRADQTAIVADIGALIGTIHRLRWMVKRLPGDDNMRLAKRAFEAQVKELEAARHHLEHLDRAIRDIADTGQGAFGAVSWWERVDDGQIRCTMFAPGTMAVGEELGVTKVPGALRERIDHVQTFIAGRHLDVSAAFWAVKRLEERLRAWGSSQVTEGWPALK